MTTFLFLQKFDGGVPVNLPYGPLMARLSQVGQVGRGRGDLEVALPVDTMAATCTVIGSVNDGVACIGFERPRFDAALRELVWDCMAQFGCAVFDDTLDTVYTTPQGRADLPASLLRACQPGARRVTSAQQLWPEDFEIGQQGPARPALRYSNTNPNGPDLQPFDYAGDNGRDLYLAIGMRAPACNPGTLRVLRNVELRVDAAISANDSYASVYRYSEHETSLLVLESPKAGELKNRATIVSPPPSDQVKPADFVADRGVFDSEAVQTDEFIRYALAKYALTFDAGMPGIATLAGLLDQAHAAYAAERDRQGAGAAFVSIGATAWAKKAGGYLGHFIAQQVGAQWGYITRAQQRLLVLRTHDGRICCPHHLVLDHVINGPGDSIVPFVGALKRDETIVVLRGEDLVRQIPVLCEQLRGVGQFDGGNDLPFAHQLARDKLDFSVSSLHYLDDYLAAVALRLGELSDQAFTDVILAAGAYLGETIRADAADAGHWRWMTYEHVAGRDPGFARLRPREIGLLAILESTEQMLFPFIHVAALLDGSARATAYDYARTLGVTGGKAIPAENVQKSVQAQDESPAVRSARHAEWSEQWHREEQQLDGVASLVILSLQVLNMLVLAYGVYAALSSFAGAAPAMGLVKRLFYGVWISGPSLFLAACLFKIERRFLPKAAMLFGGVMLMCFGVGAYGNNLAPGLEPENLTVFLLVPLAQFVWAGGWMLLMRPYVEEA
ncbi:hypothetical protein [Massilia sp. TWP1-3-3]|uniref:hypothetical protein n=1 Tax=Massilia sp. TWP1-3-3 TaxID=2804573 RepID=UPI003CEFC523